MLTETSCLEHKLALDLRELAKRELSIENIRQELAQQPFFEPEFAFNQLDRKRKGYISLADLMLFIK